MKWLNVAFLPIGFLLGTHLKKHSEAIRTETSAQEMTVDDRDHARKILYARNGIKASEEEGWVYERPVYAELFDVPLAFLEAVARAENGEVGYEMGQKSVHPAIKVLVLDGRLRQELQAARTLDRMAWTFLLENPSYGEEYRKNVPRKRWEQEDFLLRYKSKYLDHLSQNWPDPKRDDPEAWRKNMSFFVHRWLKTSR